MKAAFELLRCATAVLCLMAGWETLAQGRGQDQISDRISSQVSGAQARSVIDRLVKYELSISQTKGRIATARFQPSNEIFFQHFENGTLIVWDFSAGAQVAELRLPVGASPIYFVSGPSRVVVLDRNQLLRIGLSQADDMISERLIPDTNITAAASSADGRWIFAGTTNGEILKIAIAGTIAWRKKIFDAAPADITTAPDGSRIAAVTQDGRVSVLDESGNPATTLSGVRRLGAITSEGRQFHLTSSNGLMTVGADNVPAVHGLRLDSQSAQLSANAKGDSLLITSDRGDLVLRTAGTTKSVENNIKVAAFIGDRRYLSVRNDGVTYLRSLDVEHYLVAIVPGASGWVIVDHEGRYDGTVDGTKDVSWKGEGGGLNLDQFFDAYYKPGLLASYVTAQEKRDLAPLPGKPREGLFAPPKVELDFPDGKMKAGVEYKVVVIAESRGGDVQDEIRVFHNGKRLPPKARIGAQKIQRDGRLLLVQVFAFVPEPGPNEVFAESRNNHDVSGRSDIKREVVEGNRPAGNLQVLGIGIDKYRLSRINLDFAGVDVKALVSRLTSGAASAYAKVAQSLTMDEEATGQGIKSLLSKLSALDPSDTLVIMLAGHGDIFNGEWYFLPHDVDVNNLPRTAISIRELQDALVASPVRRIFLMVDACHSGAGIDSFNRYRAFQRRFVQQIGRNAGISVLTATRRDQQAAEIAQLGHGLFTHVVLEGLAGAADTAPKDGRISAHELASFVGLNLEQRARPFLESLGLSQSPAHFVIGADFLISSGHP